MTKPDLPNQSDPSAVPPGSDTPSSSNLKQRPTLDRDLTSKPTFDLPPNAPSNRRGRVHIVRDRVKRHPRVSKIGRLKPTAIVPGWAWPPSRRTWIRLALATTIIVLAVVTNRTFLGWGLCATVAVLLIPVGRARSFFLSFVPYAAVWFVFSALRSLADETMLAETMNTHVWSFERWTFGGTLPTILLQDRFFDATHLRLQDYFLTGIHWSYFIVPHAVAARIWHRDPRVFRHYLSAMTILLAVGLCMYFLIPSDPPWLSPDPVNSPAAVQVQRVMEPVGKNLGGGLYSASYKVIGESNPIAAMPSIHMAITFLLIFIAARANRKWLIGALAYSFFMGLALVYLGEHYVVDIVVGMLIAAYGWFAASLWLARVAPVISNRFSRSTTRARAPAAIHPQMRTERLDQLGPFSHTVGSVDADHNMATARPRGYRDGPS